jgi:hypothetical protein
MSKVFLACPTRASEDEQLVNSFASVLSGYGHEVYTDRRPGTGHAWAAEVERHIERSDYFILILTTTAARSEMAQSEFRVARDYAALAKGRPRLIIVPVPAALPVPHQFCTGQIDSPGCYVMPADTLRGSVDVLAGFEDRADQFRWIPAQRVSVAIEDRHYVHRHADDELNHLLRGNGRTIILKGSRQTGKTNLLLRASEQIASPRRRFVWLDFESVDQATIRDLRRFMTMYLATCAEQLAVPQPHMHHEEVALIPAFTRAMEHFLNATTDPVTLIFNRADHLCDSSFGQEFFAMLRSWHERRGRSKRGWGQMDIIIAVAAEPYLFLHDVSRSPFNVGQTIEVSDFAESEADRLNQSFGKPFETADLMKLFAGHPFLTRRACELVHSGEWAANHLLRSAAADDGPFADHLRHQAFVLQRQRDLAVSYSSFLRSRTLTDERQILRLLAAGLIKRVSRDFTPRCELYERYFRERLTAGA